MRLEDPVVSQEFPLISKGWKYFQIKKELYPARFGSNPIFNYVNIYIHMFPPILIEEDKEYKEEISSLRGKWS